MTLRVINTDQANTSIGGEIINSIGSPNVLVGTGDEVIVFEDVTLAADRSLVDVTALDDFDLIMNGDGFAGSNAFRIDCSSSLGEWDFEVSVSIGNDTLIGGEGNDTLNGGAGDDEITAGLGKDVMRGNRGEDVFIITEALGSTTSAVDRIRDFQSGQDLIDLSAIATFDFIGSAAFSGTGAEVRFQTTGSGLRFDVDMDGDGDGSADMRVNMNNISVLTTEDFIL
ncbi:M10 family metallopeptidase C-terminal domain-containing protein [Ascidiaceihabitans sp.]|uniref:calcium-binding protein n=1 Tax=Ascidiaceihabitans sp. TaxID=1872644 RepID=UPI003297D776